VTDHQLRRYERDPGCTVARVGFLCALARSGGSASARVRLRAWAGDPLAQQATGLVPPAELRPWAYGLRPWTREVRFAAARAAVEAVAARHRELLEAGPPAVWTGYHLAEATNALEQLTEFVAWHGADLQRLARIRWPEAWQPWWGSSLVRDLATFLRKSTRSASAAAKCLLRASESPELGAGEVRAAAESALRLGFPLEEAGAGSSPLPPPHSLGESRSRRASPLIPSTCTTT